jgi:RNA polymerase sigma factor (TIGR02999 family)
VTYERGGHEDEKIEALLADYSAGDSEAFDRLLPLVYEDLKRIAHRGLASEPSGHTLNTTAVVHEAYLNLVGGSASWQNRGHFFAVASRVIRHILIDYARARAAAKRGGGAVVIPLNDDLDGELPSTVELLELDQALSELAEKDARLGQIVEYRFFGGMSMVEVAETLGISRRTAHRDWLRARAYLYRALGPDAP